MEKSFNSQLPDRSIGKKLKEARERAGYTIPEVSRILKIREEYLKAIERDRFENFDSDVFAKGFIKNYSNFLKLDSQNLISLYKRDYEKRVHEKIFKIKKVKEKKKGSSSEKKLTFTRRGLTFILAMFLILILFAGVAGVVSQIFHPPKLKITSPVEASSGETKSIQTKDKFVKISGETDGSNFIKINDEPIALNPGFIFTTENQSITSEKNLFIIQAQSQFGVRSEIRLEVIRTDLQNLSKGIREIVVVLKEKPTFLLIRVDGLIKFNDIAVPNEAISLIAEKNIEIESSEPQYINIQIENENYQMEKTFERFELLESGEISRIR